MENPPSVKAVEYVFERRGSIAITLRFSEVLRIPQRLFDHLSPLGMIGFHEGILACSGEGSRWIVNAANRAAASVCLH